jgi:hypothetical protein
MKVIKKIVILIFLLVGFMFANSTLTFAATHPESSIHGFTVDDSAYNISWDARRTQNAYQNGAIKGTVTTYVGVARSKFYLSNNKQVSTVMIRSIVTPKKYTYEQKVLWWTNTITEYGMVRELKYSMNFDTFELLDVSPKNAPTSNNYTIGINAGLSATTANGGSFGGSLGISASQTFTANALNVVNLSDTSNNFASTSYRYQISIWRADWQRNSYAFYESEQKAAYAIASNSRAYRYLYIYATFDSADAEPNWWQNILSKNSSTTYAAIIYV